MNARSAKCFHHRVVLQKIERPSLVALAAEQAVMTEGATRISCMSKQSVLTEGTIY